jgi:hypothetical protein
MKKRLTVAIAAAAVAVLPATAALADSHLILPDIITEGVGVGYDSEDSAQVTVVHGVPDLEVDILIDGETSPITGFNYQDIVTTELPAGDYTLGVAAAGSTDAILSADVTLEAGVAYVAAAHLTEAGEPTLSAFGVEDELAGVQIFHLAAFPAVSIIVDGDIALDDVANGDDAKVDLDGGGTLTAVGVGVAGSADAAIEVGDVTVGAEDVLLVFAVGGGEEEATDDDADDAGDDAGEEEEVEQPHSVDSGTGGLVQSGLPAWVAGLMVLGALALATPAVAAARRRS